VLIEIEPPPMKGAGKLLKMLEMGVLRVGDVKKTWTFDIGSGTDHSTDPSDTVHQPSESDGTQR